MPRAGARGRSSRGPTRNLATDAAREDPPALRRLLIRLPNWLGDVLMARPLLHALAAQFPDARRIAVGGGGALELLAAGDPALERHPWPKTRPERTRLTRTLRAEPADLALVLPGSFSSALFAFRTGARRRIGYAGEGRTPLLTAALPRPPRGDLHLSEEYLALAAPLGVAGGEPPRLAVAPSHREAALARLAAAGLAGREFAILAPGARYGPAKRWPAERFARVGDALHARGLAVVLAGDGADREAAADVATRMRAPRVDLAGATSVAEAAGLCAAARVVVSNDSGLAHLAAAVGAPTVAIFGSTSSAWTAPRGPRVRIVQRAPVCSPCFRRDCAIGYRCLTAIEPGDVERAAREAAA